MDNKLVNAKVIYKDINNDQIISSRKITGKTGQRISPDAYKKYVPKGYQFKKYGWFDRNLKNKDVNIIYIESSHNHAKGMIMVDYINVNNQLIGHNTFTSKVGSQFITSQCKATIPQGYQLNKILTGKNIDTFKAHSQIIVVQISKIHYAEIKIEYLANNKLVGKAKAKGAVGSRFNVSRYIKTVPKGYTYDKINDQIPKTFNHNCTVHVIVNKIKSTPKVKDHNNVDNNPKEIGTILMKLASSLHDLGMMISEDQKL